MFRQPLSHSWLFLSLLLLLAFSSSGLHASPVAKPPIVATLDKAFDYSAKNCRVPFRVKLENTTSSDRTATLELKESWGSGKGNTHTYPFFIPAGESIQAVVYPSVSYNLLYEIKESSEGSFYIDINTDTKDLYAVIQENTPADWHLLSTSSFDAGVSPCDLMKWPADYRVYEGQSCLIIPEKTYQTYFDEAHRKAIRQWVLGGGNLWLIGDKGQPVSTQMLGHGRILHVPSLEGLPEKEKKLKLEEFVKLHVKRGSYPPLSATAPYFLSTPSTLLGLVLIIFAVLVGPMCLFLWAPAGKRHRLFLLIPSISLGFSILLFLLILIGDGMGGTGKREVLIQINPQDHSGLITQSQICKTSVLLSNSFKLPENAGITGTRLERTGKSTRNTEDIKNATRQGEWCGGNWFTSRSTLKHQLIMPVSSRAELTLLETLPDGTPVFQSTFPGTLRHLAYQDASGKYWTIEQLPPGQRTHALPSVPVEKPSEPLPEHFLATMDPVEGELGPISTLPSITWEKTTITVSGPVSATPQPHEQP